MRFFPLHPAQSRVIPFAKYLVTLQKLKEQNPDCVGWLEIPGLDISYPAVQAKDNDYYMNRTFEGSANGAGAIFFDYRTAPLVTGFNSVVYGHNRKDGTMFAALKNYTAGDALTTSPTVWIYTDAKAYRFKVVSGRVTGTDDFAYEFQTDSTSASAFYAAAADASGQGVASGSRLLTLSTCVDGSQNTDKRITVQAVLEEILEPEE